jgi:hypothetical protein
VRLFFHNKRIFISSCQNDQKAHDQVQQQLNSIKQAHQHELNEQVMNLQKEKLKASEIQQQLEFLTIQMKENIVKEVETQQEEEKKQLELEVYTLYIPFFICFYEVSFATFTRKEII